MLHKKILKRKSRGFKNYDRFIFLLQFQSGSILQAFILKKVKMVASDFANFCKCVASLGLATCTNNIYACTLPLSSIPEICFSTATLCPELFFPFYTSLFSLILSKHSSTFTGPEMYVYCIYFLLIHF